MTPKRIFSELLVERHVSLHLLRGDLRIFGYDTPQMFTAAALPADCIVTILKVLISVS